MKYDLHIHTKYSITCGHLEPSRVLKIAKKKKLDGIAVCDHNTIKGALLAAKLNRDKDFEVIVCDEIETQYGDIILYHVQEEIKSNDLFGVLDEAKRQGCVVVVPHAFRGVPFFSNMGFSYPIEKIKKRIHAIEAINGRNFFWMNRLAEKKASELKLAKTAGSDAHFAYEIAKVYTVFEDDFRKAIKNKKTEIHGTTLFGLIGASDRFVKNRVFGF